MHDTPDHAASAFDAVVIGSGATGGVAALTLTSRGLRTLVLEAGPALNGARTYGNDISNLVRRMSQRWFRRHQFNQELHGGYWETNPDLFVDDRKHPYTTPPDRPYRWIRGRQVGGRSHTWGGVTLRMSDFEFKAGRDGMSADWPISSADLSPYYANLESFFRVCGARDGLEQLPDGNFLDPSPFSPAEAIFKNRVEQRLGRSVIISRGIRARRAAENGDAYSRLSSPMTSLAAARATGNLTLRPDSIVSAIMTHKTGGRATGVEYLDRVTRKVHHIHSRLVVLCASTIESLRILMLSRSAAHPQGIGARSGLLGRGLMDHIVSNVYFYLPDLGESSGYELLGSDSIIVPRYRNLKDEEAAFRRGYGFWGGISRSDSLSPLRRRKGIALGFLSGMGETLADDSNTVTLNPSVKDALGLPVAHIACKWTDNDLRLAAAMRADAEEMVAMAGGELTTLTDALHTPFISAFAKAVQKQWELTVPGLFVHEVGGARMGTHPNTSVTNPFCQIWEVPNVLVADGACWPSSGWQNPTLTQMAVAARACDNAVNELKAGNL